MEENAEKYRLKKRLSALIQEKIPVVILPGEIEAFMQTGTIPTTWLEKIFKNDVSPSIIGQIYALMDFIHMDLSDEEEDQNLDNSPEPKKPAARVTKKLPSAKKKIPAKKPLKKSPAPKPIPPTRDKGLEHLQKELPRKKPTPSADKIANNLFLQFIKSTLDEKTQKVLNLTQLSLIISKNLIGHVVSHSPRDEILTLYDENQCPVAKFSTKEIVVVSE